MANGITSFRIVCALGLIFCPTFSTWFFVLYLLGGISDILDGFVARHFGKETTFGANLDTVADVIFAVVVILKVVLTVTVPEWILIWTICIAVVKCINIICGFVVQKRFVSEHTALNKVCGVLLFAIPIYMGVFPWKVVMVLLALTGVFATIAAIQEGHYICMGKEA